MTGSPNSNGLAVSNCFEEGDFLGIAEIVTSSEWEVAKFLNTGLEWDSRRFQNLDVPIGLDEVVYTGNIKSGQIDVSQARFHVYGEDEMSVLVDEESIDFVRVDPLSKDMIAKFKEVYITHHHLLCLNALREQRGTAVAKAG